MPPELEAERDFRKKKKEENEGDSNLTKSLTFTDFLNVNCTVARPKSPQLFYYATTNPGYSPNDVKMPTSSAK